MILLERKWVLESWRNWIVLRGESDIVWQLCWRTHWWTSEAKCDLTVMTKKIRRHGEDMVKWCKDIETSHKPGTRKSFWCLIDDDWSLIKLCGSSWLFGCATSTWQKGKRLNRQHLSWRPSYSDGKINGAWKGWGAWQVWGIQWQVWERLGTGRVDADQKRNCLKIAWAHPHADVGKYRWIHWVTFTLFDWWDHPIYPHPSLFWIFLGYCGLFAIKNH